MNSDNRSNPDDNVEKSITLLRQKLLDMTNRNPLLNFRHTNRSLRFIRAIDELPNQLYEKLSNETSMAFRSIGQAEIHPKDEQGIQFQRALDAGKLSDPDYLKAAQELGEEPGEKSLQRLETELRIRLRVSLGMPDRKCKTEVSSIEQAQKLGLNPSFDLPFESVEREGKHTDSFIQTMLFNESLERSLFNLRENVRLSIDESGVNPLFSVFGFLEWYEDENSEIALHAPLILLPLEMDRELVRGNYQYRIVGTGEGALINVALKERLKLDFNFTLPELLAEDTPESYFTTVERAVERMKGWKVKRWVTIGLFSFARIAMYHDLEPKNWEPFGGIDKHPKIRRLLTGESRNSNLSIEETDIQRNEALDDELNIPLIADADSSQLEAIRDVLNRRDLVIEGPPGTGKSQTITNLIAAALSQGKRVLFLAEKMAALSVVKDRLSHADLDDFCLELHSTKAGRKETSEKLCRRLARTKPQQVDDEMNSTLNHLASTRLHLQAVMNELSKPAGKMNCSVQELLWRCHSVREQTSSVPSDIDEIVFEEVSGYSDTDIQQLAIVIDSFERCRARLKDYCGLAINHPWYGVARPDMDPIKAQDVIRKISQLAESIIPLCQMSDQLHELVGISFTTSDQLQVIARFRCSNSLVPDLLVAKLSIASSYRAIVNFVELLSEVRTHQFECKKLLGADFDLLSVDCLTLFRLNSKLDALKLKEQTVAEARQLLAKREKEMEDWSSVATCMRDMGHVCGLESELNAEAERMIVVAVELAAQIDPAMLSNRLPEFMSPGLVAKLEAKINAQVALQLQRDALDTEYVIHHDQDTSQLRRDAATIRAGGMFAVFSSEWRAAQARFRGICKVPKKLSKYQVASVLDSIVEYLWNLRKLKNIR